MAEKKKTTKEKLMETLLLHKGYVMLFVYYNNIYNDYRQEEKNKHTGQKKNALS